VLIGTLRPGVSQDWIANTSRLAHSSRLDLPRLGAKDLGLLLADSFRSEDLAHSLGMKIAMKSDGNPFFAFEIIRSLREGQSIAQKDDGTWVTTQVIDEIEIPSSVLDLVNARVADLTEAERDLLDVAACWGFEFDPGLVAEALGAAVLPTLKSFGQIERRHRLVRASGRRYVFDHHQVQETLYSSIFEQVREHYHAALARSLESRTNAIEQSPDDLDGALCVDLCDHYLLGGRGESALRYLPAAQEHLRSGYVNARLIALSERALAVPGLLAGVERARVLLVLGGVLGLSLQSEREFECVAEAERLAEEAGDGELQRIALSSIGMVCARLSRYDEAVTASSRGVALARARGDRNAEAGASVGFGSILLMRGLPAEAERHFAHALALCREIGFRPGEASAAGNLGTALSVRGRLTEALEWLELQLEISREPETATVNRATRETSGTSSSRSVCPASHRCAPSDRSRSAARPPTHRARRMDSTIWRSHTWRSEPPTDSNSWKPVLPSARRASTASSGR
jgi:adenylate cyclase